MKTEKQTIENAVIDLLSDIAINYCKWSKSIKDRNGNDSEYRDEQARDFGASLTYKVGGKLIKILTKDRKNGQSTVWGFIVRENNTVKCKTSECYFQKGDLLKAATWKQAARNFSRGNILNGQMVNLYGSTPDYPNYKTCWSGAN
jgi:hypothetical protein